MAAYSAVASLQQLLKELLDSDEFPLDRPKPLIHSLHDKVCSLQHSLDVIFPAPKNIRIAAKDLEIRIRDAIYKFQDAIESFIIGRSLSSESGEIPGDQSSKTIFLDEMMADVDRVEEEANKMADAVKKYKPTLNLFSEQTQPSASSSSRKSAMIVGQDEGKKRLKVELMSTDDRLQVVPISGMAGIGKTTLARSIYDDEHILQRFSVRSWVTVSLDYNIQEILSELLSSMERYGQFMETVGRGSDYGDLCTRLHQNLYGTRYLIVIDDIWDVNVWDQIRRSFPDDKRGSRIVLTTRDAKVAGYAKAFGFRLVMRPLDLDESWLLLRHTVFGGDSYCPRHLQEVGKRIAKNCDGLPLLITVVGGVLSRGSRTVEYWSSIDKDVDAAAAAEDGDSYSEILSLSYIHLPAQLKACFLYMAAFPKDSEISVSKLIKLWVAEGLLSPPSEHIAAPPSRIEHIAEGVSEPPSEPWSIEQVAEQSLEELIRRNLIFVCKCSSDGRIKTCRVSNSLHGLAKKESEDEKFFYSIKKHGEKLEEGAQSQRRVSVHETVLMCRKQVYQSTESIKLARSLLYVDPRYHYPLPFCLTFKLLKVFDALAVFFIEFPNEVTKLIHLRYLSLTYNGKLPSSLSKLKNLQILMVRRQPKIIVLGISFLPEEIWDMPRLRHLLFTESDLPDLSGAKLPAQNTVLLINLQSLSNVSAASCTKEALQNMPNLKKLDMWIQEPGPVGFYLDELQQLEAFKFTVLNPIPRKRIDFQPGLVFPKKLRKLTLSGCGLPWDDIEVIRQLPLLEVLKLRELAFHGEEWYLEDRDGFPVLKFLLLEYLNLKYWGAMHYHFPSLERLIIKHCYELEEIDPEIGDIATLQLIELVDCNAEAVNWAEEIKEEQKQYNKGLQVRIYSSWA